MLSSLIRLTLVVALFFSGLIGSLHLQPPPVSGSEGYFGNCSMPCWEGVHPGVTTRAQAGNVLHALGWTLRGQCMAAGYQSCDLYMHDDIGLVAYLYANQEQIKQVALFRSGLSLGDLWMALGSPRYSVISPRTYRAASLNTAFWFSPGHISTLTNFPCPSSYADVLRTPIDTILVWTSLTAMQGGAFGSIGDLRLAMNRVCGA